jgi:acetylornithine deacetylase
VKPSSPNPLDALVGELASWIDIPTVTGHEDGFARTAAAALGEAGFQVSLVEIAPGRPNVLAWRGSGRLLFCTHLDTVPPFIPARRMGDRLFGRGACDAKGVFACMLDASRRLMREGEGDLAFLLVVGEEVDHAGARQAASQVRAVGLEVGGVVLGEPTELKLMQAQKGILKLVLRATGRAAHSGYPERGESAIDKLLEALARIRPLSLGSDPLLGPALMNIGVVRGGVAANVVAPAAEAEVLFRTVAVGDGLLDRVREALGGGIEVEVACQTDPVHLHVLPGFPTSVAGFATDAPYLAALGPVVLAGPGSILDAHMSDEHITFEQLAAGVDLYVNLGRQLLAGAAGVRTSVSA